MMTKIDCTAIVTGILQDKLLIPRERITEEFYDLPLTGGHFQLDSIGLAYLFFELEKQIGFRIDANKLLNYEFNTVNGIILLLTTDS